MKNQQPVNVAMSPRSNICNLFLETCEPLRIAAWLFAAIIRDPDCHGEN